MLATQERATTTPDNFNPSAPTDIFGRRVEVGSTIVYATRRGSSTFLNKLRITEVSPTTVTGFNPDDINRRRRTLRNFDTVARVF